MKHALLDAAHATSKQRCQGVGDLGVLDDESPIVVGETKEHLNIPIRLWMWPLLNSLDPLRVHAYSMTAQDEAEELKFFLEELTLGFVGVKLVLAEALKNASQMCFVLSL
jgi:hypothetical protein